MVTSRRPKDIHRLLKNIASISDSQAKVVEWDGDDMNRMVVRIKPKAGLYYGGTFDFEIDSTCYPEDSPSVTCRTKIYHPNIDCMEDENNICLNILDSGWNTNFTLEDVVQGCLFLLYNPNLEDPLSPLFDSKTSYDEYSENVLKSLKGEEIDDVQFEVNYSVEGESSDVTGNGSNSEVEGIVHTVLLEMVDKIADDIRDVEKITKEMENVTFTTKAEALDLEDTKILGEQDKDTSAERDTTKIMSFENFPIVFRQCSELQQKYDFGNIENLPLDLGSTDLIYASSDSLSNIQNYVRPSGHLERMLNTPLFVDPLVPEINVIVKVFGRLVQSIFCCFERNRAIDNSIDGIVRR